MFDYGVCFGGMLRGYASGYASRSVKTKVVAFSEGMLQGMLRGYASGYASPKSNIPALQKLDTLKRDKPTPKLIDKLTAQVAKYVPFQVHHVVQAQYFNSVLISSNSNSILD